MQWPDNEEFSRQFMRMLSAAQEGGSTVAECLLAARQIDPADDDSWRREWTKLADTNRDRGGRAFDHGNTRTAQSNWLRATAYYRTAIRFMALGDPRTRALVDQMQRCSRRFLEHLTPAGEVVDIARPGSSPLPGYFLPAPWPAHRAPVVICVGGNESCKEEHLHGLPRYAHERGMSLLIVDLPGQGPCPAADPVGRHEIERAISSCVDYLVDRGDIDERQIAIFGSDVGSSHATRAAVADHRFAAAVCDAGIRDFYERIFMVQRFSGSAGPQSVKADIRKYSRYSIARTVKCPMLVVLDDQDWIDAGEVAGFCRALKAQDVNVKLVKFSVPGAAAPARIDNPSLRHEYIFDWISNCLDSRIPPGAPRSLELIGYSEPPWRMP